DTYVKLVETIVKIYVFVENTVEKVVNIYNAIVIKFVEIYGTVDAAIQKAYEIFNKIFDTIIEIKANVEDDIYNIVIAIVKAYQYTIDVLVKVYGTIENAIVVIGQIYDYIVHLVIEYKPFVENAFDILSKVYADIVEIVVNGPEEANALVEYAAAQIGAYITGILTDFDAFVRATHYDALNGDYELKDDSYYVALGNSPFGEELAAKLNLLEKYTQSGFRGNNDYLDLVADADLVTIKVDDNEFVAFAEKQVAGTVASIIRNNERLMELYNHDIVGAYVQSVVAEYGIDINAQTEELDWDKYLDEECQEMLGNALALVKAQLVENGIPEYYYIDLQPLVERALEENGLAGLPGITITMDPIEVPVADIAIYTIECALFAYARFTNDLNALVESVINVVPNATVVLLGINNPLEGFDVDFGEYGIDCIDFEDCVTAMDVVVNALNAQLYLKGLTNENVIFVFENDADAIYDALHVYCDHVYDDCLDTNCNRCLEEREAPGHSFTNYVSNGDATCTADGTETAKCDNCEAIDTRIDEDSMLEHDMTTKTCTSPARCRVCGYTDGTTLNHTWKSATCTTPRTCEVCRQKQGTALGHSFGKWQTLVEATRRQSGLEKHTCLRCGLVEQRVIP
ncbi:MAG: hypothetical protein J6Q06_04560, partial [Clostridia bacterium]|nr:hypothetical protein [Clostridia bacterium]